MNEMELINKLLATLQSGNHFSMADFVKVGGPAYSAKLNNRLNLLAYKKQLVRKVAKARGTQVATWAKL